MKIPDWYMVISDWPDAIVEAAGVDIKSADAVLIKHLAGAIMFRWRRTAELNPNPETEFERLYKANERNAKAAIIAILELVNTVGAGKPMLPQYEDLLK